MSKNIIGLTGKISSGKDTTADYICDVYGYTKYSLSSPIKQGLSVMFNIPLDTLNDRYLKESIDERFNKTYRYMLQTLGTEWARNMIDTDIFTKLAYDRIKDIDKVVISDIRFDNEAKFIKDLGGHIIQLYRYNSVQSHHSSELGISKSLIDFKLNNNGTKHNLYTNIDSIISTIES